MTKRLGKTVTLFLVMSPLIIADVKVLVDSKALMSVIGSEMDYIEDPISSRFVFQNPNVKESCGCGLSFRI